MGCRDGIGNLHMERARQYYYVPGVTRLVVTCSSELEIGLRCGSERRALLLSTSSALSSQSVSVLSQESAVEMQVAVRHDVTELDELLAFVGDFGLGNGADLMKTEAANPHDMTEAAWLDDLDDLLRDTKPQQLPLAVNGAAGRAAAEEERVKDTAVDVASPQATKAAKKPRISRKEELQYLRKKVEDMETQLHQLKAKSDEREADSPAQGAHSPADQATELSIALWRTISNRQRTQRDWAEVENAKLREKLKTQVRMAKSLQRILCKRALDHDQVQYEPCRCTRLLNDFLTRRTPPISLRRRLRSAQSCFCEPRAARPLLSTACWSAWTSSTLRRTTALRSPLRLRSPSRRSARETPSSAPPTGCTSSSRTANSSRSICPQSTGLCGGS
jgi:hypothetical protein